MPHKELFDQNGSVCLLEPNTREGFGLVLLDAIARGVSMIGGEADESVDPLSCSPIAIAVRPEQVANVIARALKTPPREREPNALADRFGRAAFAAQLAHAAASAG